MLVPCEYFTIIQLFFLYDISVESMEGKIVFEFL